MPGVLARFQLQSYNRDMRFTLYTKPGCCLCDDAKDVLRAFMDEEPAELEEIDIESDPALMDAYGERIPVVAIDGVELFQYKVHPKRLRLVVRRLREKSGE